MSSKDQPPAFPVPVRPSLQEDELTRQFEGMRFGPPQNPPPGWAGGFAPLQIPLSVLSQHDPFLSANGYRQDKPLPLPPQSIQAAPQASGPGPSFPKPSPYGGGGRVGSGYGATHANDSGPSSGPQMSMPVPTPYSPSSSAPALVPPSYPNNRRTSNPLPQASSSYPELPVSPRKTPSPPAGSGSKLRPSRRRTASESGETQCAGTTKNGKRCSRTVKSAPTAYLYLDSDEPIERYCFQHTKEILAPTGFFSKKTDPPHVSFSIYVPDHLQEDTKVALRAEMEKPVSTANVPGYIYCFEILNNDTPDFVHFKVGRTTSLKKRIDQWGKQCGSKEQALRGWWPSEPNVSLLKGKLQAGEKGPHCHRLEKLIHLELADVAENTPYLQSGWPNPTLTAADTTPAATKTKKARLSQARMSGRECADCGTVHKEIFTLAKAMGSYKNKEWELIVLPIIEKWGGFVEGCL